MKRCLAMLLLSSALAGCQGGAPDQTRQAPAPTTFEMQKVEVHRYRAGRLVLSASADRLQAEDLANWWRAEGVRAEFQPEER